MSTFMDLMPAGEGTRVLDLGGQPEIWEAVAPKLSLLILNVPGVAVTEFPSHHQVTYVEGDACAMEGYEPKSFDMVFSNSVIEHVGDSAHRRDFAQNARSLGLSYWVQTPSRWFPVEAHCGMPFWWQYPAPLRRWFIRKWRLKLPAWTEMVEGTTVLSKAEMRTLFPEATIIVERLFGFPKSYVAYNVGTHDRVA
jgi:hypothetical protein